MNSATASLDMLLQIILVPGASAVNIVKSDTRIFLFFSFFCFSFLPDLPSALFLRRHTFYWSMTSVMLLQANRGQLLLALLLAVDDPDFPEDLGVMQEP